LVACPYSTHHASCRPAPSRWGHRRVISWPQSRPRFNALSRAVSSCTVYHCHFHLSETGIHNSDSNSPCVCCCQSFWCDWLCSHISFTTMTRIHSLTHVPIMPNPLTRLLLSKSQCVQSSFILTFSSVILAISHFPTDSNLWPFNPEANLLPAELLRQDILWELVLESLRAKNKVNK
jgi:hypothetical protein